VRNLRDALARDVRTAVLNAQMAFQRIAVTKQLLDQSNTALELAQAISASAPLSVAAVLEIMQSTEGRSVAEGYRIMRGDGLPAYRRMLSSEDAREGVRAFGERRAPRWTGR